jgi:hypothetical protein
MTPTTAIARPRAGAALLVVLTAWLAPPAALAGAAPDPAHDPRFHEPCQTLWPFLQTAPRDLSLRCVDHWLVLSYGPRWTDDDLDLDPVGCRDPDPRIGIGDVRRMMRHLQSACTASDPAIATTRCKRAVEALSWLLDEKTGFGDHYAELQITAAPVFDALLAGRPLTREMLATAAGGYSPGMLRRLRNAVFARHGKPFANADLQDFFNGPAAAERWDGFAHPPRLSPDYSDRRLTTIDQANLALIHAEERAPRRQVPSW